MFGGLYMDVLILERTWMCMFGGLYRDILHWFCSLGSGSCFTLPPTIHVVGQKPAFPPSMAVILERTWMCMFGGLYMDVLILERTWMCMFGGLYRDIRILEHIFIPLSYLFHTLKTAIKTAKNSVLSALKINDAHEVPNQVIVAKTDG